MDKLDQVTYKTINSSSEGIFKEKGSKFLAFAFPVSTEDEIKEHLAELRKEHYNARHYCYAYRINPKQIYERSNDDGEPRHSAGTPILGQLLSFEVVNTLIVVVRYFGGTKLGVPGLVNAYKTAARFALESADIITRTHRVHALLTFDYEELNDVMQVIKRYDASIIKQEMLQNINMKLEIREDHLSLMQRDFYSFKSVNFRAL